MPLHIIAEANRCYNCKNPQCQQGCPVHTPIPQIIQLFKEHPLPPYLLPGGYAHPHGDPAVQGEPAHGGGEDPL